MLIYGNAKVQIFAKQGDSRPRREATLTGDHFVADAAGFTNGWQISDFESVLYFASQSEAEKQYWMHAVAGVIRRLMEPMDALPPQYAKVAMHRHSTKVNKGPAFDHRTVPFIDIEHVEPSVDAEPARPPPPRPPPPPPPPRRVDGEEGDEKRSPPPPPPRRVDGEESDEKRTPPPPPPPRHVDGEEGDEKRSTHADLAPNLIDTMEAQRDVAEAAAAREAAAAKANAERVAVLEARCGELECENRTLRHDIDDAMTEVSAAKHELEAATCDAAAEIARLSAEAAAERKRGEDAEMRASTAEERLGTRVAELEHELAQAKAETSRERLEAAGTAQLDQQTLKWTKALTLEQQRSTELARKVKALTEEHRCAKRDLDNATRQLQHLAAKRPIDDAESKAKAARDKADRDKLAESLAKAQAECASLRSEVSDVSDGLRAAVAESAEYRAKLQAVEAELASFKSSAATRNSAHLSSGTKDNQRRPPPPPRLPSRKGDKKPPPPPHRPVSTQAELEARLVEETAKVWSMRAKAIEQEQKLNAFSTHFDSNASKQAAKHTYEYGTPLPGSLTEQRWQKGKAWVDEQIDKLVTVIRQIGATENGVTTVTFVSSTVAILF